MAQEIERKFLLEHIPFDEMQNSGEVSIVQGYLLLEDKWELRVRKADNKFCITRKSGSGLVREEHEENIDEDLFNFLWPLTEGKRVEKHRFTFEYDDHNCEIDIYSGKLAGLIVMEVEFPTEQDARGFSPPPFVKHEITDDSRYKNARLAKFGKPVED